MEEKQTKQLIMFYEIVLGFRLSTWKMMLLKIHSFSFVMN